MKKLLIPLLALLALSLTACDTVTRLAQLAAFPVAGAIETRIGANCIRAEEAGQTPSRVPVFDLRQAREVFDARHRPFVSLSEATALDRMRVNTDRVCPDPFVPRVTAPLEAEMPATPPAEPPPG